MNNEAQHCHRRRDFSWKKIERIRVSMMEWDEDPSSMDRFASDRRCTTGLSKHCAAAIASECTTRTTRITDARRHASQISSIRANVDER
jgi:hypothetical protein